ncbi:MAG TPA: VOC family protein [Streptosporangiaceae bacterium]|jgi:predicted enzyme related to lactoylglutathione lyase
MPTRLVNLVIDATDPSRLASFWAGLLRWEVTGDEPDIAEVEPLPTGFSNPLAGELPLTFLAVSEPKVTKNRIHLDLASSSLSEQAEIVQRAIRLGAARVDIGQGDVPWVVLADPEGNEFCVLEPREVYRDTGPVAAIVVDCVNSQAMAAFWTVAANWPIQQSNDQLVALRALANDGPCLEMLAVGEPKNVKNRVHLDVAPYPDDDQRAEEARLTELGAKLADIGQGDVSWIVMADPEGQEFCVLTSR